ncbi:MAG TPA: DUF488 domain-containing protein [Chitinophagaceae bacterium]|nr:DUF488 domain-containing protein [Chitinophagaceae bacterium]
MNKPVYTIGHGTRKAEDLVALLKQYGVRYLLDVRSCPYSRFNPQYNKQQLQSFLQQNEITYVFMGDTLGGRPDDPSCYDVHGKIDYETLKDKEYFKSGIVRVKTALEKDLDIALMCSERKPAECHRSRLIGQVLFKDGIEMRHIDDLGGIKDQATVMSEIKGGTNAPGLFE